jgi:hypothetical protein
LKAIIKYAFEWQHRFGWAYGLRLLINVLDFSFNGLICFYLVFVLFRSESGSKCTGF